MNGKILDCAAVAAVVATFFAFAIFHPGIANLLVAWFGAVTLGYYNVYVRHDPKLVAATRGAERAVDHSTTLRPAWR
ncbi:hypothetical protein KHQ06_17115 [Nocardia tengchongensis]|uniref:Uncharacterized protein n=1 Tax=Nocardia tengchongensis TaxID=2055889 RepID=A0ABX8CXE4_9NOCA|nr:hypothetical protein [Nocardia tengchongensis]QVI24327.1 hypothetical protein KHQ06_17115 [Nocardia tengchongensis]